MDFKFEIDGIGIQFETVYRKKVGTGIQYQIKQLLGFWHSRKEYAYVLVYQRNEHGEFTRFPNEVVKVWKDGNYQPISIEEWEEDRKIVRR